MRGVLYFAVSGITTKGVLCDGLSRDCVEICSILCKLVCVSIYKDVFINKDATMFTNGNTAGKHNNHWKGGRLTKDQHAMLTELATKGLAKWKEILEKTQEKWLPLQAQVTRDIINKFAPDKHETEKVVRTVNEEIEDGLRDIADRVERKDKRIELRVANSGESINVQG